MRIALNEARCSGCRTCQVICSLHNFAENNPKKAAVKIVGHFPAPGRFEIKICNQCGVCAAVCQFEAIAEKDGVYVIDREKCTGCGECIEACPSNAMVKHPAETAPIKCVACGECVTLCQRGALYDADVREVQ
ncbi:4Fe-4S ferredoxin iron-sulfur binding domain-containing protein [Desulfotomaculum nigrificans CO-1-SRB]|uniref:4Fe-4S ferredoxin iron-sulfur binding domain-containing protein n=1 Tax=Desulfotomaculum nigrificans (strain DSM 14880 / VKM B-2319 / CO-1-SRB) TaxID=868595 RepID=F6B4R5_DESCC|nr:4Fe-4S binding protein [Desulfotomaculum nigrificans]AEF94177.1 4Fe-4S ferredoxin iron-sulfur binding domain-containing protein [Desulfotomaculum nigrificans CO-1-SRB]